ncbi:PGPGW domain-containing protein [Nocardioides rubriscoriae]|uniref:PGPGW domain-containing protein n=1 Tax=Nocardioides rubriscoriae TaxID=642762 RepID=UPI0011DF9819|nr:PGPGW domain-containing protein [Nocardioides rubriscoriae]
MGARVRRWGVVVAGWLLLAVGVVLFPLPGPGLLVMLAGLLLLARESEWAERQVVALRERVLEEAKRGVATGWRALWSLTTCALLAASGLLWLWEPARPDWWVLPAWTWLPGGWAAGVSQLVSGLLTLGLVGYAWACRLTGSGMLRP